MHNQEDLDEAAWQWAYHLTPKDLHWAMTCLASNIDSFNPEFRKAVLQVATLKLDPRNVGYNYPISICRFCDQPLDPAEVSTINEVPYCPDCYEEELNA